MKLWIGRDGVKLVIKVTVFVPYVGERVFTFDWECSNETYAGLLASRFSDAMESRISHIRREAYERGWNDHKKRKPREEYFSGCINE